MNFDVKKVTLLVFKITIEKVLTEKAMSNSHTVLRNTSLYGTITQVPRMFRI